MSTITSTIEVMNMDEMSDFDRINSNLKALVLSREGTIPGSRGFGLSEDFLNAPPLDAASDIAAELDEKCEDYIPEITIDKVEIDVVSGGTTRLGIYIEERSDS